ncbi:MAG: imidazole glycerol phosphate synthase subunit HisH [Fusobacteria bacterium]|nr:imidazole glycerol phosphate synthase subunit HisH [Fusobacteriota bacterium]
MIAIIDYEMGSLVKLKKALNLYEENVIITRDKDIISKADKIILAGKGNFEDAMKNIDKLELREIIKSEALKKPFLAINLGMEILFETCEGAEDIKGLGILRGRTAKFIEKNNIKIPQLGWNSVKKTRNSRLFEDIEENSYFYFIHSYYIVPKDEDIVVGIADYGTKYVAAIEKGNVMGTQFYLDKSGDTGIKILKNFINI